VNEKAGTTEGLEGMIVGIHLRHGTSHMSSSSWRPTRKRISSWSARTRIRTCEVGS
jgi:hypothetical protein